jgi:hypothetical protein
VADLTKPEVDYSASTAVAAVGIVGQWRFGVVDAAAVAAFGHGLGTSTRPAAINDIWDYPAEKGIAAEPTYHVRHPAEQRGQRRRDPLPQRSAAS